MNTSESTSLYDDLFKSMTTTPNTPPVVPEDTKSVKPKVKLVQGFFDNKKLETEVNASPRKSEPKKKPIPEKEESVLSDDDSDDEDAEEDEEEEEDESDEEEEESDDEESDESDEKPRKIVKRKSPPKASVAARNNSQKAKPQTQPEPAKNGNNAILRKMQDLSKREENLNKREAELIKRENEFKQNNDEKIEIESLIQKLLHVKQSIMRYQEIQSVSEKAISSALRNLQDEEETIQPVKPMKATTSKKEESMEIIANPAKVETIQLSREKLQQLIPVSTFRIIDEITWSENRFFHCFAYESPTNGLEIEIQNESNALTVFSMSIKPNFYAK